MKRTVKERDFIKILRKSLPGAGLGDDAALFKPTQGCEQLLTCDLLVEKVHFDLKTIAPWELGAKAVAASLSDVAAMGGRPRAFLVSLGMPKRKGLSTDFFKSLYAGMEAWSSSFGAKLAGGDTSSSPGPLFIDIFMLGEVEQGRALTRSGARPGDLICCTGTLGDSAAGLAALKHKRGVPKDAAALAIKRHRLPVPRVLAGRFLVTKRAASSCIDVSDGLASELAHLAEESGVGMDIEATAVPLSGVCIRVAEALKTDPLQWALHGGEDYELLFTVKPSKMAMLQHEFGRLTGSGLHVLGRVRKGKGVRMRVNKKWRKLGSGGYEHSIF
ncbi:MAG: thiamine-phosphate kinase [candidate division FCPU426 bacterium]